MVWGQVAGAVVGGYMANQAAKKQAKIDFGGSRQRLQFGRVGRRQLNIGQGSHHLINPVQITPRLLTNDLAG